MEDAGVESYAFQHGSFTAIKYLPLMIRGYQFGTYHNYYMLYRFVSFTSSVF